MEYEIKWWEDWINADSLERQEMVEKLPFTSSVTDLMKSGLEDKLLTHSVATMLNSFFEDLEVLNSFFEDLEGAMYVKKYHEEEAKKNEDRPKED